MDRDTVGCALAHALGDGAVWRFAALSSEVASVVVGLLGGAAQNGGDSGLEVVTAASALRVYVLAAGEAALYFRLAESAALGAFELRFRHWSLVEVLGPEAGALIDQLSDTTLCELAVRSVDFTTLGGRIVRFTAPSLVRCP
ncbi:hypothetical protein ACFZB9_25755 [Kitasatospora sp. NPDC008050]|uniref:hypothetical protein n=1 Tax=Kitasatospora sp. NPDC008050 TaxID=3364021 RepID=UPI0036E6CC60